MYAKILSAILLIAIAAEIHCGELKDLPPDVDKCLKLNLGEDYAEKSNLNKLSKEDRKKFLCAVGCLIKGEVAGEGKTMQKFFLNGLTKDDSKNSEVAALTEKLNSCASVGDDECKFMECLDKSSQSWKSRIDSWVESFVSDE